MARLQGARITGSIIATTFIKANGFSGSITASNLYVLGKAGIGTSSPSNTKLHIVGDWISGHSTVKVQGLTDNTTGYGFYNTVGSRLGYIAYTGTGFEWYNNESVPTVFYTNTSEKMRITSGGDVGIGTSSPIQKLHIVGSTLITNGNYHYGYTLVGAQASLIGITASDNILVGQSNVNHANTIIYGGLGVIDLSTSGSTRMRVGYNGDVGIGTTTPDIFGRF
jgi:hypothetical protein